MEWLSRMRSGDSGIGYLLYKKRAIGGPIALVINPDIRSGHVEYLPHVNHVGAGQIVGNHQGMNRGPETDGNGVQGVAGLNDISVITWPIRPVRPVRPIRSVRPVWPIWPARPLLIGRLAVIAGTGD